MCESKREGEREENKLNQKVRVRDEEREKKLRRGETNREKRERVTEGQSACVCA